MDGYYKAVFFLKLKSLRKAEEYFNGEGMTKMTPFQRE